MNREQALNYLHCSGMSEEQINSVVEGLTSPDAVSREAVIELLMKLEQEDIERYGCKIPEGFDAEEAVEAVRKLPPVNTEPARWNKLYTWLNDMRFGIAPDETTPEKDRAERWAQVELLDDIMAWMKPDEWPFSDPYEEGESE